MFPIPGTKTTRLQVMVATTATSLHLSPRSCGSALIVASPTNLSAHIAMGANIRKGDIALQDVQQTRQLKKSGKKNKTMNMCLSLFLSLLVRP
jgi:hypothetical protein